jgi:hypothetical protein
MKKCKSNDVKNKHLWVNKLKHGKRFGRQRRDAIICARARGRANMGYTVVSLETFVAHFILCMHMYLVGTQGAVAALNRGNIID